MSSNLDDHGPNHLEAVSLYALQALPPNEIPVLEAHLAACRECRDELQSLCSVVDRFAAWPTDVLRPPQPLWEKLARRIAKETGAEPLLTPPPAVAQPDWKDAAPGISVKLLATDHEGNRVSMLVRLAPDTDYPPHCHAGVEELYLLQGELMVNDRKFHPGDYIHADAGTVDHRVWSKTGCTCILITSTEDAIL
jgi:anti-sigma factor ChrR (cupin superfamily)